MSNVERVIIHDFALVTANTTNRSRSYCVVLSLLGRAMALLRQVHLARFLAFSQGVPPFSWLSHRILSRQTSASRCYRLLTVHLGCGCVGNLLEGIHLQCVVESWLGFDGRGPAAGWSDHVLVLGCPCTHARSDVRLCRVASSLQGLINPSTHLSFGLFRL